MDLNAIRRKFGGDFVADERTYIMGSDQRFTSHFAERFKDLKVLETCTGAGFATMSLAKTATHVFTVEVDKSIQQQALNNVQKAELLNHVSFIHGDILDQSLLGNLPSVDAAFIDPDWAVSGPDHEYRFINSNTRPPADTLLSKVFELTKNIAIVLPPYIDIREFKGLSKYERESLYLDGSHELFCLYFGKLIRTHGETEFHVSD
ncbi:MAG: hypothetical protein SWH54_04390 [Thermodesulfobacteriota bacterium]|nr:hypothetical protein [Thermodesulfobacteriota bacterium]